MWWVVGIVLILVIFHWIGLAFDVVENSSPWVGVIIFIVFTYVLTFHLAPFLVGH